MAKCGVEKYDNLPARVGTIDVDAMRYYYKNSSEKIEKYTKRLYEVMVQLDTAIRKEKNKNGRKTKKSMV